MSFLKTENIDGRTQSTFIGNECEIYVPEEYFKHGFAQMKGLLCDTLGLYYFRVEGELKMLNFPSKIQFQYSGEITKQRMVLKPGMPSTQYRIFKLNKGSAFVWDQHREKTTDDLLFPLMQLVEGGKYPSFLAYQELISVLINMFRAAGEKTDYLDVPFMLIELLTTNACRYSKNTNIPMRKKYNVKNQYDFKYVPLKRVTATLSTLNALMGEDMSKQMMAAVLRTRTREDEPENPLEQVMKY